MGVRFQAHPRDDDSQIILHVRMLDREKAAQQEALGIVGVNLLYGAFFLHHEPELLVESLLDNLTTERIEIDMIEFSGHRVPARRQPRDEPEARPARADRRGDVRAPTATVLQPSEVLLQEAGPGRARQLPAGHPRQRRHARAAPASSSRREPGVEGETVVPLMEITMRNLMRASRRRRLPRLPRARRRAGRVRQDRADLRLLRVLPARGLPRRVTPSKPIGIVDGRRQPARALRREVLRRTSTAASSSRSGGSSRTT